MPLYKINKFITQTFQCVDNHRMFEPRHCYETTKLYLQILLGKARQRGVFVHVDWPFQPIAKHLSLQFYGKLQTKIYLLILMARETNNVRGCS